MKKTLYITGTIIVYAALILILAIVGLFIGAMIGGNFFTEFIYQGQQGYEGAGVLGMQIGIALGVILVIARETKKYQKGRKG